MALIVCRECKAPISSAAKACPKCGAPAARKSGCGVAVVLVCVLLGLGLVALLWIGAGDSGPIPESEAPATSKRMAVSVSWDRTTLRITNTSAGDELAGKVMTIYVNGTPPFAYKVRMAAPPAGQSVEIPLTAFVKDGTVFNPATQVVTEAWIGGDGFDYRKFIK